MTRPFSIPIYQQVAELAAAVASVGSAFDVRHTGISEQTVDSITESLGDTPVSLKCVIELTGLSKPTVILGLRILVERQVCKKALATNARKKWQYSLSE